MSNEQGREKVQRFLQENFLMQIATSYQENPLVSVMIYTVDKELNLYFITKDHSRKSSNLKLNPRISATVWDKENMMIMIQGEAKQIEDAKTIEWVMDTLAEVAVKQDGFWPPLLQMSGSYIFFKLKPTSIQYLDLSDKTFQKKKNLFIEIPL